MRSQTNFRYTDFVKILQVLKKIVMWWSQEAKDYVDRA